MAILFAETSAKARQNLTILTAETAHAAVNREKPQRCNF
jgi:hypothetical protein